eukprot:1817868-Rhodomonas_salina.1
MNRHLQPPPGAKVVGSQPQATQAQRPGLHKLKLLSRGAPAGEPDSDDVKFCPKRNSFKQYRRQTKLPSGCTKCSVLDRRRTRRVATLMWQHRSAYSAQNGVRRGDARTVAAERHEMREGSLIKEGRLLFKFGVRAADFWHPAVVKVNTEKFIVTPTERRNSGYSGPVVDAQLADLKLLPLAQDGDGFEIEWMAGDDAMRNGGIFILLRATTGDRYEWIAALKHAISARQIGSGSAVAHKIEEHTRPVAAIEDRIAQRRGRGERTFTSREEKTAAKEANGRRGQGHRFEQTANGRNEKRGGVGGLGVVLRTSSGRRGVLVEK